MAQISKKVGDLLIIFITGDPQNYVAEVVEEDPLVLKVMEEGLLSRLKDGDFIVREEFTRRLQENEESAAALLKERQEYRRPLVSGLASLGVTDGRLHEILCVPPPP